MVVKRKVTKLHMNTTGQTESVVWLCVKASDDRELKVDFENHLTGPCMVMMEPAVPYWKLSRTG